MKVAKVVISIILLFSVLVTTVYASDDYGSLLLVPKGFQIQEKSNWCWVACARNSVRFERLILRSQKSAVKKIKGSDIDAGGSIFEIEEAAEYISYGNENYTGVKKKLSFDNLRKQLDRENITITCMGNYDGNDFRWGGHAVVIIGYIVGTNGRYIYYVDPADDSSHICSYESFCDGSYNNLKYDYTCYNNE